MDIDLEDDHAGHDVVTRPSATAAGIMHHQCEGDIPTEEMRTVKYCRDCERVIER